MGIGYGIAYRLAEAVPTWLSPIWTARRPRTRNYLVKAGFEATATQTNVVEERDVERWSPPRPSSTATSTSW